MDLTASIEIILMVILGGPGTLIGPALGAGIIVFLKNFISAYTQRWLLIWERSISSPFSMRRRGSMNLLKDWLKGSQKKARGGGRSLGGGVEDIDLKDKRQHRKIRHVDKI